MKFQGRRTENGSYRHWLLTRHIFNGKKSITIDDLRQRRFNHPTKKNPDDEVLNQGNLAEGFFFALYIEVDRWVFFDDFRELVTTMRRGDGS